MSSSYWMPNTLPEPTNEWEVEQIKKFYYTREGEVRPFPGWYYDNGAAVCDDYLYHNEGWKLLITNEPKPRHDQQVELKPQDQWEHGEKTVTKTFWVRTIVDDIPEYDHSTHKIEATPVHAWDYTDEYVVKTYSVIPMTQEEIDFEIKKRWSDFKEEREIRLRKTDWVTIQALERGLTVSPEMLEYRQKLRDLPDLLTDIWSDFMELFPELPTNYFV